MITTLLVVAVIVLGAAVCFNTLVLAAVVHRLKLLSTATRGGAATGTLPHFESASIDGESITSRRLAEREDAVLAFFSASCQACKDQVALFADRSAALPYGDVVAVVSGGLADSQPLIAEARRAAVVIHEEDTGSLTAAFRVGVFPTYLRVQRGRIVSAVHRADELALVAGA